jgi:lysophospholipase L1-like esterase
VRFVGRSIALRLRGSEDQLGVRVDDVTLPRLVLDRARERYVVAHDLDAGEHELMVHKRTEALVGEVQLLGVELDDDGRLLPPPPARGRRIELIGDSITAGYGVLASDPSTPFSPATEDFALSYGGLMAGLLDADVVAVAWSGRGVCRNYDDEPGATLPALYERTLPARPASRWDFARWIPDAVVINLGTNDFSCGRGPAPRAFGDAYQALVARVRAAYAGAHIFCALGPMLDDAPLAEARALIDRALDGLRAEGLTRLEYVEHPPQSPAEGYGCDYHPSAATHRRMAAQLTGIIRARLGW